jgi:hypothetical protein
MARPCPAAPTYQRRQPEQTVLYRTIAAHLPTFLARTGGADGTGGWPTFVRREFEAYLKCGRRIAFSCRRSNKMPPRKGGETLRN